MSKYAIDFDSVLAERKGIPTKEEDTNMLIPVKDALEGVMWLTKRGHELYVYTSHDSLSEVKDWLKDNNFPDLRVTKEKEKGTKAYVDDRAIRFTSWQDIRKLLE